MRRIITIDPSLTSTGWCLAMHDKHRAINVVSVGRILPTGRGCVRERARRIASDLIDVINEAKPDVVVIEVPSGHVTSRHKGGGSGLATYGMAVGIVLNELIHAVGDSRVVDVEESAWTGSRSQGGRRKIALKHFASLRDITDPGRDVSDAVALAVWWVQVGQHRGTKT